MKCRKCGAPMREGEGAFMVPYKDGKVMAGGLRAYVCTSCGRRVPMPGQIEKAQRMLKGESFGQEGS